MNDDVAKAFSIWRTFTHRQASGSRVPAAWLDILKDENELGRVVMVFDLVFGNGKSVRISSIPVSSVDGEGENHDANPWLIQEPELKSRITIGTAVSAARQIAITVPSEVIDPASFIQSGTLMAGWAEVYLTRDGDDHDHRYVLMRGEMAGGVSFGATRGPGESEVAELDIVDPRASLATRVPSLVIDSVDFPTAEENAIGRRIPVVIGKYSGVYGIRFASSSPTSLPDFAFAEGSGWTVPQVWVNGEVQLPGDPIYGFTVLTETLGDRTFSYVNFTNPGTAWTSSDTVYVDARHSIEENSFTIITAIRAILDRHSDFGAIGLNDALFGFAESKVPPISPSMMVNASGNAGTDVIQYVESGFLSSFPMVSMVWDRGSYGPVVIDARLNPVIDLEVGGHLLFDRVSDLREISKEAIQNDFILRYDYDPVSNSHRKVATRNSTNDPFCRSSVGFAGTRAAPELLSPYIVEDEMAGYVLDWMVLHKSIPSYTVTYEGSAALLFLLRRGDTFRLTDSDFSFDNAKSVVESINYRRGRCRIGIRVWSNYWLKG